MTNPIAGIRFVNPAAPSLRIAPGRRGCSYTVTDRPVSPQDLHATILQSMGLDSNRLVYHHHGLRETPLGVTGGAPVMEVFG